MDQNAFKFMPLTHSQAAEVLNFRYAPPLDFYNPPPAYPGAIENLIDPKWQFHGIEYDGQLAGYASFGADGQLPGGDYTAPALDIGLGLHPNHIGQGYGSAFVAAILNFGINTFAPEALRLTVAVFNQRAVRLYQSLGFEETARFFHHQTEYLVLTKRLTSRQSG
jgi:RimJ/RimL family protein N-acetyltransferase